MPVPSGNILVMDADAECRERTCATLARVFHRCCGVATAADALRAVRDGVDVALIDSGEDPSWDVRLARQLRGAVVDLVVVLIAREPNLDAALDAMRVGVFDYLLKPFSSDELVDAVGRGLQWRDAAVRQGRTAARHDGDPRGRFEKLRTIVDLAAASPAVLDRLVDGLYDGQDATTEHLRRVADHAGGLAATMGLAGAALDDVVHAGLLHEIGKLALPERMAAKPTPLTNHELELFRTYPELGAELIRSVPFLSGAASIIACTRERYDGTGYPRGLRHASIPLGSGIVAIADLFDSIVCAGAAADAVPAAVANAELVRAAGTCFDPLLVAGWLRYLDAAQPSTASATAWGHSA